MILALLKHNPPLFIIRYVLMPVFFYVLFQSYPEFTFGILIGLYLLHTITLGLYRLIDNISKSTFGYTPHEFFDKTHKEAIEKIKEEARKDGD